jgi:hypothetical protein
MGEYFTANIDRLGEKFTSARLGPGKRDTLNSMSERNGDKARFAKAKKKRLRHRENMKKLVSGSRERPVRPGGSSAR